MGRRGQAPASLDAAVYKHAVLRLIFLKYVSDSFAARRAAVEEMLRDPDDDYSLPRDDYDSDEAYAEAIHQELEDRDYYTEANVFWVPPLARWQTLRDSAKLPAGTEIEVSNGKKKKYTIHAGTMARRPRGTPTSPGSSTCCITSPRPARWRYCSPTVR